MLENEKLRYLLITAILVLAVSISACTQAPTGQAGAATAEKEPFTVGVLAPLTGNGANLGKPFVNGMRLAAEEINEEGGVNGHKIELKIEDSKLNPKDSINAAKYLMNAENPGMFSVFFHPPAEAVSGFLKGKKTPFIYESFGSNIAQRNKYAFKANFDPAVGCKKLAEYVKRNKGHEKIGLIMPEGPWVPPCEEGASQVYPNNLEKYTHKFGQSDYRTLLLKAKNDGVDAIIHIGFEQTFVNIQKQLHELDYDIELLCATSSECIFPKVKKQVPEESLEGRIGVDFLPLDLSQTDFGKKYREKHPNPAEIEYNYGAVGYEEIQIMAEAMKNCQPGQKECLRKQLNSVEGYNSLIGSEGFEDRILRIDHHINRYSDGSWSSIG